MHTKINCIGIVILNYNDWINALNCIKSINEEDNKTYRIYFIDNCSTSNKTILNEIVKYTHKAILLSTNNGYSSGNNAGIKAALNDGCTHILICNTDIIFTKNVLATLIKRMELDNYSIIAPRVKIDDNNYQEIILGTIVNKYSKFALMLRSSPFKIFIKKYAETFRAQKLSQEKFFEVYGVSGCFFLMNDKAIKCVTPLDEDFFLYNEEYVIGKKMFDAKLKTCITNEAYIYHLGGKSTSSLKSLSYGYFIKSEQLLLKKYYNAGRFLRFLYLSTRLALPMMHLIKRKITLNEFNKILRVIK